VRASLEVDESRLLYKIGNSKPIGGTGSGETGGIGLKNVRRRLDLSYPGRYKLDIDDQDASFFVALTIDGL
jgi:sensor histidine kinase YesM